MPERIGLFITEVEIKIEAESKRPYLYQKFFINKVRVGGWYSLDFTDQEIVNDLNACAKYPDETFILRKPHV